MQDSFFNTGDFFLESGVERRESFTVPPPIWSLVNALGWAVVILTPMLYFLLGLLFSGKLLYFSIACGIFGACKYFIMILYYLQVIYGFTKVHSRLDKEAKNRSHTGAVRNDAWGYVQAYSLSFS